MKRLTTLLLAAFALPALAQHKEIVRTSNSLALPFSPGVVSNGLLFVSGQLGTDPKTSKLVEGGIEAETAQVIQNVKRVLEAAGASLDDVVSVTVYMSNLDEFGKMNAVYKQHFKEGTYPARTTVGVAKLVYGAAVEMTMTAALPPKK
jgi:2-iminobutanoate/2-iminopropanoate deaminase